MSCWMVDWVTIDPLVVKSTPMTETPVSKAIKGCIMLGI